MKKLLFLFFAAGLIVACNNKKDDRRSSRDRDRERDDYRSKEDDKNNDTKNTNYKDEKDNNNESPDRDDKVSRDNDRKNNDNVTGADGWPSYERRAFVNECVPAAKKNGLTTDQATSYCECMQEKLERAYPDINEAAKIDMNSPRVKQMVEGLQA